MTEPPINPSNRTYKTKSGKILTDADIEKLAEEAERGYEVHNPLTCEFCHVDGTSAEFAELWAVAEELAAALRLLTPSMNLPQTARRVNAALASFSALRGRER